MRLFLDTSVVIAACGRAGGASRHLVEVAPERGWRLLVSSYVISEVERNLPKLPPSAAEYWARMQSRLMIVADVVTRNRPAVFLTSKDRPILFTATASADVLLTLDRKDFADLIGRGFYGLLVLKPGDWLARDRTR